MNERPPSWYQAQNFRPGRLGWLVNPFYFARRGLLDGLREFFPRLRGEVLDVGCGTKPYRGLIPAVNYVGLEIDSPIARELSMAEVFYDGKKFPFNDGCFDGVFCSQVFEHVFSPDTFLREIHRVLRPGGCLLMTVPFAWDEHEQPYDYARYSTFGLRELLKQSGFEVEFQRKTMADARVLFQLTNAYVFKITRTKRRSVNLLATLLLMAPVNLLGMLAGLILPSNPDLFLDQIVFARKKAP